MVFEAEANLTDLRPGSDVIEVRLFPTAALPESIAFEGNRRAIDDFVEAGRNQSVKDMRPTL